MYVLRLITRPETMAKAMKVDRQRVNGETPNVEHKPVNAKAKTRSYEVEDYSVEQWCKSST